MFIAKDDLKNSLYEYQIDEITEGDDTIVLQAISAGEEEVKSLLCNRYDVATVFAQTGADRNALLVSYTVAVAAFHLVDLSNADIIWEQAKGRYDRAIKYLDKLASGAANISSLPAIEGDDEQATGVARYGSRTKFTHEY